MKRGTLALTLAGLAILVAGLGLVRPARAQKSPAKHPRSPRSLDEARRTVRMMNDIYISGVLITHKMYASEAGSAAAVTWGKEVIRDINGKGWPIARIFGVGDRMLNPGNQPIDAFEREAGAALTRGKAEFERAGPAEYRLAVPIRVTEQSCLNCHARNKMGDLLGGVSYRALIRKP